MCVARVEKFPIVLEFTSFQDIIMFHKRERFGLEKVQNCEINVKVVLDMGFYPYKMEESYLGWQIIKKLTNHEKLKNIEDIEESKMYNSLYLQAYNFLKQHFQEPFTYKVWDDKKHIIGINNGKNTHIYTYKFNNNKLEIIDEVNENSRTNQQ